MVVVMGMLVFGLVGALVVLFSFFGGALMGTFLLVVGLLGYVVSTVFMLGRAAGTLLSAAARKLGWLERAGEPRRAAAAALSRDALPQPVVGYAGADAAATAVFAEQRVDGGVAVKDEERAIAQGAGQLIGPIVYPRSCVVAVMDEGGRSRSALEALTDAGFKASVFEGGRGPDRADEDVPPLAKAGRFLKGLVVEEDRWQIGYEAERRAGRDIVVVEVQDHVQAHRAASLLAEGGSRSVRSFGSWFITDLFPAPAAAQADQAAAAAPIFSSFSVAAADLHGIDIFRDLSYAELHRVVEAGGGMLIPQGTVLAQEGEIGSSVYLILEGQVQLETATQHGEMTVRIADVGESLPLAALLGSGRLITSAHAMTDLRVFDLPCSAFKDLVRRRPEIGMKVYQAVADILGGRYGNTLARLADTLEYGLPQRSELFANV